MIRAEPEDFVRPPANVLAQLMLQCARDDPTLVKRSRGKARATQIEGKQLLATRPEPGSPLMLLSSSDPATRQYLEDLVSIAIASSERADAVLGEADAARRKAARAVWVFASIAAIGVAVGVAGIVDNHRGNKPDNRLTEIAAEIRSLGEQQQQVDHQLAAVRSETAVGREAAASVQQAATSSPQEATRAYADGVMPAASLQPSQPAVATPVSPPLQQATYSPPWPASPQPVRPMWPTQQSWPTNPQPVQASWPARQRHVVVPRFLVVMQQDLRALFR